MIRKHIPLLIFVILFSAFIISCIMYNYNSSNIIFITLKNVIITLTVHFAIMISSAPLIRLTFNKKFDFNSFWFKPKNFEDSIYEFLRIKKWKNYLPIYNQNDYNIKIHTIEEVIVNMCHAEVVHEFIALTSYISIFLGKYIGTYTTFFITSFIYSFFHIFFALVQRYNRQRLMQIKIRIDNRKKL